MQLSLFRRVITDDDKYIYGCLNAGMPVERLASKLCITPDEVRRRHASVKAAAAAFAETGVENLVNVFNTVCLQYQMVGEGLKVLGTNLSDPILPEEIRKQITMSDPDQTVRNLMASFIILRPFNAPEPAVLSEKDGIVAGSNNTT